MIEKVEYPEFHTFEQGVQFLQQGNWIDYEVKVGTHTGALMTRATWLESVEDGSFIDYDGYGDQLNAEGKFVGGHAKPSLADLLQADTAYILWYNK